MPYAAVPRANVPLPFQEQKFAIDAGAVVMKRIGANWQVWAGQRMLRDVANDEDAANPGPSFATHARLSVLRGDTGQRGGEKSFSQNPTSRPRGTAACQYCA